MNKKIKIGVIVCCLFVVGLLVSQKRVRDHLCIKSSGKLCFYGSIPFKLIPPRGHLSNN